MNQDEFEIEISKKEANKLALLLRDIWIEDERKEILNDLDKDEIIVHISDWVSLLVKEGDYTYQSWYSAIFEDEDD